MRFTLGGKLHELDFERVVEAAGRAAPQDIDGRHKYYGYCSACWVVGDGCEDG